MAKQVAIDTDECLGCESCVELCPAIFAFDEDAGKAYVIQAEGGDRGCIDEAMSSCPVGCITFE